MDDVIYDELEVMFSYHGHPLSWYEFAESKHTENHDIAVAATKKMDAELKQAVSAAAREYDEKQKCVELEKGEGEKAMNIADTKAKLPACGVLGQLDASLMVKLGDIVNMSADLLALKMLHGGKGFVTGKETKGGVSTFTVTYLETEAGSRNHTESGIPVSRLAVTPLAIFGDGPKLRPRNQVVTPDGNNAEHPHKQPKSTPTRGFFKRMAKRVASPP
jgi:hypothetical protein